MKLPELSICGPASVPAGTAWWDHLFERSPAAQILCDPSGLIVATNRIAREHLRISAGTHLLGAEFLPAALTQQVREAFTSTLLTQSLRSAGGGVRPAVELHLTRLEDNDTLIEIRGGGTLWCVADAFERLFRAQRMDTLGGLVDAITHEFNNLLLAIRGNIGLVLNDPNASEFVRTRLKHADLAVDRGAVLSRQLQDFARLSDEEPQCVELNQTIKLAAALTRRILRARVVFDLQLCPDPTSVWIDPKRAEQLVVNLCLNAAEAMSPGSTVLVQSVVECEPSELSPPGKSFLRLSVSDRGKGISLDRRMEVFEPFVTSKPPSRAVGLGLTVVAWVVSRVGGTVSINDAVGGGTRVDVRLPLGRPCDSLQLLK